MSFTLDQCKRLKGLGFPQPPQENGQPFFATRTDPYIYKPTLDEVIEWVRGDDPAVEIAICNMRDRTIIHLDKWGPTAKNNWEPIAVVGDINDPRREPYPDIYSALIALAEKVKENTNGNAHDQNPDLQGKPLKLYTSRWVIEKIANWMKNDLRIAPESRTHGFDVFDYVCAGTRINLIPMPLLTDPITRGWGFIFDMDNIQMKFLDSGRLKLMLNCKDAPGLDNLVHGELAPLFVDIAVMEILALRYENARLRKKLYDMMDKRSLEVFSAERAMDRITNVVVGGM